MHFSTYRSYDDAYSLLESNLINAVQTKSTQIVAQTAAQKAPLPAAADLKAKAALEKAESWSDITLMSSVEAALDDLGGLVETLVGHRWRGHHH